MASVAAINLYYLIPGGYRHAYDDGWLNEEYKTITITSKLSEVTNGDALLA